MTDLCGMRLEGCAKHLSINPERGAGAGKGGDLIKSFVNVLRVGKGIILIDRQEIFISYTF